MLQAAHPPTHARAPALQVVIGSALAYAAAGALALLLLSPASHAARLYPAAGFALVAALMYGRMALLGTWLGASGLHVGLALSAGQGGSALFAAPLLIGAGATLQAGVGAALVRRHVSLPLVLNAPRDILAFSLAGAVLACAVSASIATPTLIVTGQISADAWLTTWLSWWVGDALGVLIGAPLALTLVGRPKADWQPRRRTLGLPLLLTLVLLVLGMSEFERLDRERLSATFQRDADRLASDAQTRLSAPLHALQALHSSALARGTMDREALSTASRWWLAQPIELQATGYSERISLANLPAFERRARDDGIEGFHVFDRDDGTSRLRDGEVVAVRGVEPLQGNAAALGANALSVPAARAAIVASRDSGQPVATAGFALTQSGSDETGFVLYQALYQGQPVDVAARRALFRGVVFVSVRAERVLGSLARPGQQYLRWCLVDPDPHAERHRLAGPAGCDTAAVPAGALRSDQMLDVCGRPAELRVIAALSAVPGHQREAGWLLALGALASAALLGALLLTVTGHSRRTQIAVQRATGDLRREMSERAHAEAALRESEARLRSILDHVPLGVMFLDPQGRLIECNPRLCEMVGRGAADLRGTSVLDLVRVEEAGQLRGLRQRLLVGPTDTLLDRMHLRRTDGGDLVVRVTATALRDPHGNVIRMIAVLDDITEHLRLEESERALHRSEAANMAKSEFVSRMSHELRTPLNAMMGFAQLLGLDRDPGLADHQHGWVQQIQRAGWHLLELINETLDLARIEAGTVQLTLVPVALAPLVEASLDMVRQGADERHISVAHVLDDDAQAVLADATRFKQVLTNLLSNAVKYNREGGAVTLTTRRLAPPVGAVGSGDVIEIAVSDTGLGMTEAQLEQLFQPYNRLGREGSGIEGTGIGLVISRRLAELMGGGLQVGSEAGVGSIFTLRLPAAAAAETPVIRYTDTSPAPYRERHVHYVEDNETNIEVMRGIFAQRAQIVLQTSTLGLDGLSAIRRRRPDLILLDMQLPDIPGIELLRHLKQDDALAAIPVVVVSADATAGNMQQALVAGAQHYVTKPVNVGQFLGIVDEILEEAQTRWN